jgi:hypothetical protein
MVTCGISQHGEYSPGSAFRGGAGDRFYNNGDRDDSPRRLRGVGRPPKGSVEAKPGRGDSRHR